MEILLLGSDTLHQKAAPVEKVDDEIRALIADMFAVMKTRNGVGLAAPQIGRLLRLFVVTADDGVPRVFINPHIIFSSDEMVSREEGCLSIPGIYGDIIRPQKITAQALDEHGKKFLLEADGLLARVIQHENDHLDGILFIDRADEIFREQTINKFKKREDRKKEKKAQKQAKAERLAAKIAAKNVKKNIRAAAENAV
ncbi:MAG: peptide deformylase [Treponemataceae bacterium]|nr:MAG: peptide deformylase [Treponemataceae bacterium]